MSGKIHATKWQYEQLYKWLSRRNLIIRDNMLVDEWSFKYKETFIPILEFSERQGMWLLDNCPFDWVKEQIISHYDMKDRLVGVYRPPIEEIMVCRTHGYETPSEIKRYPVIQTKTGRQYIRTTEGDEYWSDVQHDGSAVVLGTGEHIDKHGYLVRDDERKWGELSKDESNATDQR